MIVIYLLTCNLLVVKRIKNENNNFFARYIVYNIIVNKKQYDCNLFTRLIKIIKI